MGQSINIKILTLFIVKPKNFVDMTMSLLKQLLIYDLDMFKVQIIH